MNTKNCLLASAVALGFVCAFTGSGHASDRTSTKRLHSQMAEAENELINLPDIQYTTNIDDVISQSRIFKYRAKKSLMTATVVARFDAVSGSSQTQNSSFCLVADGVGQMMRVVRKTQFDWARGQLISAQEEKRDNGGKEGQRILVGIDPSGASFASDSEYRVKSIKDPRANPRSATSAERKVNVLMNFHDKWVTAYTDLTQALAGGEPLYDYATLIQRIRQVNPDTDASQFPQTVFFGDKGKIYRLELSLDPNREVRSIDGKGTSPGYVVSSTFQGAVLGGSSKLKPGDPLVAVEVTRDQKIPTTLVLSFDGKTAAANLDALDQSDSWANNCKEMDAFSKESVYRNDLGGVQALSLDGKWLDVDSTVEIPDSIFDRG